MLLTMKNLSIPYLNLRDNASLESISEILSNIKRNNINSVTWRHDAFVVGDFSIGYSSNALLLKFFVIEEHISARYNQPNDAVYKDSCVEFFIAFPEELEYYNFEFNCKGSSHVGFGSNRHTRELIQHLLLKDIKTQSSFKTVNMEGKAMVSWELTIVIPFESFWHHDIKSLKGQMAKVNFYKCGDELPQPHYMSWSPIEADEPNFHLPEFFGLATFEN